MTSNQPKTITIQEAQKLLGIKSNSVQCAVSRGRILRIGTNQYDKASVLAYGAYRNIYKSAGGRLTYKRKDNKQLKKRDIREAVVCSFIQDGVSPTYDILSASVDLAKSGLSRYIPELIKEGKIEKFQGCLFPPGFRMKIIELAKKELIDVA